MTRHLRSWTFPGGKQWEEWFFWRPQQTCFENYTGDFQQKLAEELKVPFHYLNIRASSSVLFFDKEQKLDYYVLAQHIHDFTANLWDGVTTYVAVSSPLDGEVLSEGYQEVEVLMENRFYRFGECIFMPDSNWEERENYDATVEMLEKMEEDVQLRDITHLWEHFHKFAEQKEHGAGFSYIFMKICLLQSGEDHV